MSTYVTATAMIGVRFSSAPIEEVTIVRGCEHDETESKFCAECGAETWESVITTDDHPIHNALNGLPNSFVHHFSDETDDVWFGMGRQITPGLDDKETIELGFPDIDKIKQQIKAILEPIECWSEEIESTFGWHLIAIWS